MLLRGIRLCITVYPEAAMRRRIDLIEQLPSVDCLGGQDEDGNEFCRIFTQNDEIAVTTKNTADRRVIQPLLYVVFVFLFPPTPFSEHQAQTIEFVRPPQEILCAHVLNDKLMLVLSKHQL